MTLNICCLSRRAMRVAIALAMLLSPFFGIAISKTVGAESYAITGATGPHSNGSTTNRMIGWIFDANQTLVVGRLGVWDFGADGLLASHQVGIWTGAGTLLGSTIVQSGVASPLAGPTAEDGRFRYAAVSPIHLNAGSRYVIGGLFNDNDEFIHAATSVIAAPQITFITERFSASGSGFVFPALTANRPGLFGTNFAFDIIPEPATLPLLGTAMFMVSGVRRRAKR
jgi:hypothetical protein